MHVHPLGPLQPLNNPSDTLITEHPPPLPDPSALSPPVETHVYIWIASASLLVPELWSFDVFVRDSAWRWVGASTHKESYDEVDRRREMNGVIVRAVENAVEHGALN